MSFPPDSRPPAKGRAPNYDGQGERENWQDQGRGRNWNSGGDRPSGDRYPRDFGRSPSPKRRKEGMDSAGGRDDRERLGPSPRDYPPGPPPSSSSNYNGNNYGARNTNGPAPGPPYNDFRGDRMDRAPAERQRGNYDSRSDGRSDGRSDQRYDGRGGDGSYGSRDGGRDNVRSSSGSSERGPPPPSSSSDRPYYGRDAPPQRDPRDSRGDPRDRDSGGLPPPPPDYRDGPPPRGPYSDMRDSRDDRGPRDGGRDGRDLRDGRDFRSDSMPGNMRGDVRPADMRDPRDLRDRDGRDGGRDGGRDSFRDRDSGGLPPLPPPSYRQQGGYGGPPPPLASQSRSDYRDKGPSNDPKYDPRYDAPIPPQRRDDHYYDERPLDMDPRGLPPPPRLDGPPLPYPSGGPLPPLPPGPIHHHQQHHLANNGPNEGGPRRSQDPDRNRDFGRRGDRDSPRSGDRERDGPGNRSGDRDGGRLDRMDRMDRMDRDESSSRDNRQDGRDNRQDNRQDNRRNNNNRSQSQQQSSIPQGSPPPLLSSDSPLRTARMDPSGGRPSLEHRHHQHNRPSIMGPSYGGRPSITASMRQQQPSFDGGNNNNGRRNDSQGQRGQQGGSYGDNRASDVEFRGSAGSPPRAYPHSYGGRPSIMQGSNNNNNNSRSSRNMEDRDRDGHFQRRTSDNASYASPAASSGADIKKEQLTDGSSSMAVDGSETTTGALAAQSTFTPSSSAPVDRQGPTQGDVLAGIEIKEDEIVEVSKELENLMKEREKLMKEVSTSESARSKGKILNLVHGLPIRPEWLSMTSAEVVKAAYEQNLRLSVRAENALTAQLVDASLRSKYAPFINYLKTTSKQFRYQAVHAAIIKNFVPISGIASPSPSPAPGIEGSSLHSSSTVAGQDGANADDSKMQVSSEPSNGTEIAQPTPSNAMQVDAPSAGNTRSSSPSASGSSNSDDVVVVDADYLPDIFKKIREKVLGESNATVSDATTIDDAEQDAVEICEEATAILQTLDNPAFFSAVSPPSIEQYDCYKANLSHHATWREAMVKVLAEKRGEIQSRAVRASKALRKTNLQWYRQLQMEREEEASRKLLQNKKWLHVAQSGRKFSVRSANNTAGGGAPGTPLSSSGDGSAPPGTLTSSSSSTVVNNPVPTTPSAGGRSTPSMMLNGSSGAMSTSGTPSRKRWLSTSVGGDDSEEEEEDEERFEATRAEVPPMLCFDEDADDHRRDMIDHNGAVEDARFVDVELKVSRPWHPDEEDVFVRAFLRFHKDFAKIASYLPGKEITEVIWFYYTRKFKLDLKRRYQREGINQLQLMTLGLSALTPSDPAAATLAHYMGSAVEWVNGNTRRGSLRLLEKGSSATPSNPSQGGPPPQGSSATSNTNSAASLPPSSSSSMMSHMKTSAFDRTDRSDPSYLPGKGYGGSSGTGSGGLRDSREKMSLMASTSSASSSSAAAASHHAMMHGEDENVEIERSLAASGGAEGNYSPGRGISETQNRWTAEEREKFKAAFDVHYKDFKAISEIMRTKNAAQCKNYYHNNKKKLGLPSIARASAEAAASHASGTSTSTGTNTTASSAITGTTGATSASNSNAIGTSSAASVTAPAPNTSSPPSSPGNSSRTMDSSDVAMNTQGGNIDDSSSSLRNSVNLSSSTSIRLSSDAVDTYNAESKTEASVASAPKNSSSSASDVPKKSISRVNTSHWTDEEKAKFKELLQVHGKDWKSLANGISSKTVNQIKNFFQNYRSKLKLDDLLPEADRNSTTARGGRGKKRKVKPRGRPKRTASSTDADDDGNTSDWMDDDSEGMSGGDETDGEDGNTSDHPNGPSDDSANGTSGSSNAESHQADDMPPRAAGKEAKRKRDEAEDSDKIDPSEAEKETDDADAQSNTSENVEETAQTSETKKSRGGARGARGGKVSRVSTPTPPPTKKRKLEAEDADD